MSTTIDGLEQQKTLGSVLTSPSIIAKLVVLSALSLGPVLYRDKLRSVLGGRSSRSTAANLNSVDSLETAGALSPVSLEGRNSLAFPSEEEVSRLRSFGAAPSGSSSPVDEHHILPLAYSAHSHARPHSVAPPLHTPSLAHTVAREESEASSTVGDPEVEAEVFDEPESLHNVQGHEDVEDLKGKRKDYSMKWYSWRWSTSWDDNVERSCRPDIGREDVEMERRSMDSGLGSEEDGLGNRF